MDVAALYDANGPRRGVAWPGLIAWLAGIAVYALAPMGATLPGLAAGVTAYGLLARRR